MTVCESDCHSRCFSKKFVRALLSSIGKSSRVVNKKLKEGLNIVLPANRKEVYKDVIPKRSTQVIIFKGKSITKVTYSSDDFDNERPPVTTIIKK